MLDIEDGVLHIIRNVFSAGINWFTALVFNMPWWEWLATAFIVYTSYRFLLLPIFGWNAGSDSVKNAVDSAMVPKKQKRTIGFTSRWGK